MYNQSDENGFGKVHIIYGNGKNKTTTANGYVMRALGAGAQVLYVQFLKDGLSSEMNVFSDLQRIGYPLEIYTPGPIDFVKGSAQETHLNHVRRSYERAYQGVQNESLDLVVCDEILYAYLFNLFCVQDITELIHTRHEGLELILTGNAGHEEISKLSDYVVSQTCLEHEKHPFYTERLSARKGIEF